MQRHGCVSSHSAAVLLSVSVAAQSSFLEIVDFFRVNINGGIRGVLNRKVTPFNLDGVPARHALECLIPEPCNRGTTTGTSTLNQLPIDPPPKTDNGNDRDNTDDSKKYKERVEQDTDTTGNH